MIDHGPRFWRDHFPIAIIALFAVLSAFMAIQSTGVCLNDDLVHYQIARLSWRYPTLLLSGWGRPGFTVPYALVAKIGSTATGFRACRLLTTLIMTAAVTLAWITAHRIRAWGAPMVPLLILLMPEGFNQSYTPCTEVPAALYAIAGIFLLTNGRHHWAAVVFAVLPATRHELVVFLVPLGLYFLWKRQWLAAILLGWAEIVWNLVSWRVGEVLPILRFFTKQDSTLYGSGNALHFFINWLKMAGTVPVILAILGASVIAMHDWRRVRSGRWRRRARAGRRARIRMAVICGAIGLVVLETLLFSFNGFASGGYSQFLVPAAPLMGICACYGVRPALRIWNQHSLIGNLGRLLLISAGVATLAIMPQPWVYLTTPWRVGLGLVLVIAVINIGRSRTESVALLAIVVAMTQWAAGARPYLLGEDQAMIGRVVMQLRHDHPRCHILSHSPWASYFDEPGLDTPPVTAGDLWRDGQLTEAYYVYNQQPGFSPPLEEVMAQPNELIWSERLGAGDEEPYVYVFRRVYVKP